MSSYQMIETNTIHDDQVISLASDEKFQDWVMRGTYSDYWHVWLKKHPDQKENVECASGLVRSYLPVGQDRVSNQTDVWHQILEQISVENSPVHRQTRWSISRYTKYAAAILLLLLSWWGMREGMSSESTTTYTTAYDEQKKILLSDNTHITLNANSSVEVFGTWDDTHHREVRLLKGEALFEVTKQPTASFSKFRVRSGKVIVEVLGTTFHMKNRRERTDVALIEGKVSIAVEGRKVMELTPGRTFSYTQNSDSIADSMEVDESIDWLNQKMHFRNADMKYIAQRIEDHYGVSVILGSAIQSKKLSGKLPMHDLDTLLSAIGESLHAEVKRENRLIYIQDKVEK